MKKISAILLSLILVFSAFGAVTASAGGDDQITCADCVYENYGFLNEETTTVTSEDGSHNFYFNYTAECSCIYRVDIECKGDASCVWTFVTDILNDDMTITDTNLNIAENCTDNCTTIYFKLDEGVTAYILADIYGDGEADVTLTPAGGIAEASCPENVIWETSADVCEDEVGIYTEFWYTLRLTFDDGSTADASILYREDSDLTDEDSFTVSDAFLGYDYTVEVNFVHTSGSVASIELPEGFTPTLTCPYSGEVTENYPEYITINYSDGTSENSPVKTDEDDGYHYAVYTIPETGDMEYIAQLYYMGDTFVISSNNTDYEFEIQTAKQSIPQIIPQFFSSLSERYRDGFEMLRAAFTEGDSSYILSAVRFIFSALSVELSYFSDYIK